MRKIAGFEGWFNDTPPTYFTNYEHRPVVTESGWSFRGSI